MPHIYGWSKRQSQIFKGIFKLRAGETVYFLIDFGTCSLHSVHGSMKTREIASKWESKKTRKSAHTIMHDSPARREGYASCFRIETLPTKLLCNPLWFCFWIFLVTEFKQGKTLWHKQTYQGTVHYRKIMTTEDWLAI